MSKARIPSGNGRCQWHLIPWGYEHKPGSYRHALRSYRYTLRGWGRCFCKVRGKNGSRGRLQILGEALYGRMLKKERGRQIKLIDLVETVGKLSEGDRIKAVF
jgi:hypothetical protein